MTTPHTHGRLTFRENGDANSYALLDDTGNWLMSLLHNGQQATDTQRENLRRLVVCWNACEGIPTADLQKHEADPAPIFALLMETAAQRDELLASLKAVMDHDCPITGNFTHAELIEHWEYEKTQGRGEADMRITALNAIARAERGGA